MWLCIVQCILDLFKMNADAAYILYGLCGRSSASGIIRQLGDAGADMEAFVPAWKKHSHWCVLSYQCCYHLHSWEPFTNNWISGHDLPLTTLCAQYHLTAALLLHNMSVMSCVTPHKHITACGPEICTGRYWDILLGNRSSMSDDTTDPFHPMDDICTWGAFL